VVSAARDFQTVVCLSSMSSDRAPPKDTVSFRKDEFFAVEADLTKIKLKKVFDLFDLFFIFLHSYRTINYVPIIFATFLALP
jgi:hypothetical protein